MTFPVEFEILGRSVPSHGVMELIAYTVGFRSYISIRRRENPTKQSAEISIWIIVACIFGAFVGSKILAWLESPTDYLHHDFRMWLAGKTIVGGLIGGWVGVEIAKKYFCITKKTGDAFVLPLVLGIAIGRVGCFLTGLPDHTYGIATSLPWGVDFGDGIPRHPTQIYEIIFVLALGAAIWLRFRWPFARGELFRLFMFGYFAFRFAVEFIKPRYTGYFHLSMIQWASAIGAIIALRGVIKLIRSQKHDPTTVA
jgi:phosphatidylglycerol:prolipoprotein diacylglycerol transferase